MSFALDAFAELFPFGKWVLGLHIVTILQNQADRLILGGLLGSTALGIYQVSSKLSSEAFQDLYKTTQKVLWPIYSKVQDDTERTRRAFVHVLQLTAFLSLPAGAVLFILTPKLVPVVFTAQWTASIPYMRVLIFVGVLRTITYTGLPLFRGSGRPSVEFGQTLAFLLVQAPAVALGAYLYGLDGAVGGLLLAEAVLVPVWAGLVQRETAVRPARVARILAPPLAVAAVSGIAASLAGRIPLELTSLATLVVGLVLAGGTYLTALHVARTVLKNRSLDLLFRRLRGIAAASREHIEPS